MKSSINHVTIIKKSKALIMVRFQEIFSFPILGLYFILLDRK